MLPQLTGSVAVGDRVVVNTTAVELGLGTGGWHVVHWNLARDDVQRTEARATSSRAATRACRPTSAAPRSTSPRSAEIESIDGMPVVAAALHSQVAAVAVAFKDAPPDARLAYVMTDGAGCPLALSRPRRPARGRELVDATVTCGHAFGGDFEAVSIFSALAVARTVARADAAVVAMGPGSSGPTPGSASAGMEVGPDTRRRRRARRTPDRLSPGFVRRSPPPSSRLVAPPGDRPAAGMSRARPGGAASPRRRRGRPLRADLADAGIDRRHDVVEVDPPDVLTLFERDASRSSRWAARPRTTPCSSKPERGRRRAAPPASLATVPDRALERLTNLVARSSRPAAHFRSTRSSSWSPATPTITHRRRRQFERDKDTLRGVGDPTVEPTVDPLGADVGYMHRPQGVRAPVVGSHRSRTGGVARRGHRGSAGRRRRRRALGSSAGREGDPAAAIADLPNVPALPVLFDA